MDWEAPRLGNPERAALARMVLTHRALPRDPLKAEAAPIPNGPLAMADA
jgi:acyl-CoA dehydrogenase